MLYGRTGVGPVRTPGDLDHPSDHLSADESGGTTGEHPPGAVRLTPRVVPAGVWLGAGAGWVVLGVLRRVFGPAKSSNDARSKGARQSPRPRSREQRVAEVRQVSFSGGSCVLGEAGHWPNNR